MFFSPSSRSFLILILFTKTSRRRKCKKRQWFCRYVYSGNHPSLPSFPSSIPEGNFRGSDVRSVVFLKKRHDSRCGCSCPRLVVPTGLVAPPLSDTLTYLRRRGVDRRDCQPFTSGSPNPPSDGGHSLCLSDFGSVVPLPQYCCYRRGTSDPPMSLDEKETLTLGFPSTPSANPAFVRFSWSLSLQFFLPRVKLIPP